MVHGWVYGLKDGLVRDLGLSVRSNDEVDSKYPLALENVASMSS